jgi:hypothetical protein
VARVRVVGALGRLVGASEADEVGRHHPKPGAGDDRDHLPVQEAPGRLAVQEQHRVGVGRPFVDIVDAQRAALAVGDVEVAGREREVGECAKRSSGVRSASITRRRKARSMRAVLRAASDDRSLEAEHQVDASRPPRLHHQTLPSASSRRPSSGANTSSISARESLRASESTGQSGRERLLQYRPAHVSRRLVDARSLPDEGVDPVSSGPPGMHCTRSRTRSKWRARLR